MLVGSLKLQRYHKMKSSDRLGDTSAFTHRSFVFMIDGNGRVAAPLRATKFVRATVEALDGRDSRDFHHRFAAISAALGLRA